MKRYGVEEPTKTWSSAINNRIFSSFGPLPRGNMEVLKNYERTLSKDVYFEEVRSVTSDMSVYQLKLGTGG